MADDILKFRAGDLHSIVLEQAADRDVTVSQFLRDAVAAFTGCDSCGECEMCGLEQITVDQLETVDTPTAAVIGFGRFSETSNPGVAALIDRAKELLTEGAVGVSIATDLDPADLPADPNDVTDEILEAAHIRPRHVAIVDTPAFSGAHLTIAEDGTLSGPIVFEGTPTGDVRGLPLDSLTWTDDLLPIPIIFDIDEGDHTGVTVGFIDRLERADNMVSEVAPIAASASDYPAALFTEPDPTPMTVHAPDSKGFRRYTGLLAPTGVCHKGMGGCYQYKGADLDYFHSGARIPLDDGTFTRVGPLVFGGIHADASKLDYNEALARTDDARRVFAMGRCFHHPKGLLFSGVLMDDADVMRIQATAPSIELWPNRSGKLELKTALQVIQPALPVAASAGGMLVVNDEPVVVETTEPALAHLMARIESLESAFAPVFAAHLAATLDDD